MPQHHLEPITRKRRRRVVTIEVLEARCLLSASVVNAGLVNVSRFPGQQSEGSIAADPSNPARLFAASNQSGMSLFAAVSSDAGLTWTRREFATGTDGLPIACCDPSAAFDAFGNLFFTYVNAETKSVDLLLSTDGGQNFRLLNEFIGDGDQPTVATGARSVWVTFRHDDFGAVAYGAPVTALDVVGRFSKRRSIQDSPGPIVGDVAIGAAGQVLTVYETPGTGDAPAKLFVRLDPDGLGRKNFAPAIEVSGTAVGDFDAIPAQSRRTIDAEPALAYDLSGGAFAGRVYLVYTDEIPDESNNTDILLRFSDDDGATWSAPIRVNDDAGTSSQFLPRIAVDRTTGAVGVTWHDARNDNGVPGQGSTNTTPNDESQFYAAVGTPTAIGIDFAPNIQVTAGVSNTAVSNNPNDYGDYTGLSFLNGNLRPVWADNSNSTGDNPNGALGPLDLYTARLQVNVTPAAAPRTLLGQFGNVGGKLTVNDADGTAVTLRLANATGFAFANGGHIDLRLSDGGRGARLNVRTRGGDGRLTLGDVVVNGDLKRLSAVTSDLTGTLFSSGNIGSISLGNLTGTLAAVGSIADLAAATLSSARVFSGANFGSDAKPGGAGADADTFANGLIRRIRTSGSVTDSLVGAGLDPVDGIYLNGNDRVVGGVLSTIDSISLRGGVDESTRFVAGAFKSAKLPTKAVPSMDPHFILL